MIMVGIEMLGIEPSNYFEDRVISGVIVPEDEPDFSKDQHWIVFGSWPEGNNHDIYIFNSAALRLTRITFDPELDFDPVWRPNWE